MKTNIFRGKDWYMFVDTEFIFGYSNGILRDHIKDIQVTYRESDGVHELMIKVQEISISVKSTNTGIELKNSIVYIYPHVNFMRVYIPQKVVIELKYLLMTNG